MKNNNFMENNKVTNDTTNNNGGINMNNKMTMDVFATEVKKTVEAMLGDGYDVKIQRVLKNNNMTLTGIVIKRTDNPVAPTIYLEQFLEDYNTGRSDIEAISKQIVSISEHSVGKVTFDVSSVTDFSACKEMICYKLVNAKRNAKLLSDVPHVLLHDLAIIFYIFLGNEEAGSASITIKNRMIELWNTTTEELYDIAKTNTQRLFPANIRPMSSVLFGIMNGSLGNENEFYDMEVTEKGLDTIYVCSNASNLWGAGAILYDGVLREIVNGSDSNDIVILPSSVHETLLIPNNLMDVTFLKQMVHEVNTTAVAPEEVLSDSVYIYHADTYEIELA